MVLTLLYKQFFQKVNYIFFQLFSIDSNFSKTSMNGLDLRSCDISGIVSYLEDIKGVILTSEQSLTFIKLLGITIID